MLYVRTGGVSYELFISLLISELFFTKSEGGEGEPTSPPASPFPRDEVNSLCPGGPQNGFAPHQNHYVPRHVNNRYIHR
jgi:hypothetical protein